MNCTSFGRNLAILLVTSCFLLYLTLAGRVTYQNYKVLRVDINDAEERMKIEEIMWLPIPEFKIDVSPDFASIIVSEASLVIVRFELGQRGLKFAFENITDVQAYIDSTAETVDGDFKTAYLPYEKIKEFLNEMVENYTTVSLSEIGVTANNCSIPLIKISLNDDLPREIIFLEFGTHAREWISIAAGLVFIDKLAREEDPIMLEKFDYYILPVHNVDGYIYSFDIDRLWRKNRRDLSDESPSCNMQYGVDLNRNWGTGHGELGLPGPVPKQFLCFIPVNPGPEPFSEAETAAVNFKLRELIDSGKTVLAYFAVHNGAQVLLLPYGYTNKTAPTLANMVAVANQMSQMMKTVENRTHDVGEIHKIFGKIGGSSVDYLYEELQIQYPIGIELRPSVSEVKKNALSFIRNETEILPASQELFEGIRRFVEIHPYSEDDTNTSG